MRRWCQVTPGSTSAGPSGDLPRWCHAEPRPNAQRPGQPLPRGLPGPGIRGTLPPVPLPALRRFTECTPRLRMNVFSGTSIGE
jgi:hypothetical protein